jgi:UDP-N-acetylglucosamine 4,6-dehydratase
VDWEKSATLITGGTGSFGRQLVRVLLDELHPRRLVIFSRDELKQHEMRASGFDHPSLRYFIGDVRDADRLRRAMHDIDLVVHAAALKQVPACEYNPIEAIMTNVMGARNVIDAALDTGVDKVIALSTDKAVNPVNLYGATKLCAEKLFAQSNAYGGADGTRFASVRYGNVVGSRGSVIPMFIQQKASGRVSITDPRMSRFWITLDQGVRFTIRCVEQMHGGEVFVPKIPSMRLTDLAEVLAPGCEQDVIGIRFGEKLHETLVSEDEARETVELDDMFVALPTQPWPARTYWPSKGNPLPEGFRYSSDSNPRWLTPAELRELANLPPDA